MGDTFHGFSWPELQMKVQDELDAVVGQCPSAVATGQHVLKCANQKYGVIPHKTSIGGFCFSALQVYFF